MHSSSASQAVFAFGAACGRPAVARKRCRTLGAASRGRPLRRAGARIAAGRGDAGRRSARALRQSRGRARFSGSSVRAYAARISSPPFRRSSSNSARKPRFAANAGHAARSSPGKPSTAHTRFRCIRLTQAEDEEEEADTAPETGGVLIIAEDQTELLALERARQEFLTNVSHELRTPLSSIKLMLETVTESGDEEARRIFLPQALGQVDRLATLVQRLLEQAQGRIGRDGAANRGDRSRRSCAADRRVVSAAGGLGRRGLGVATLRPAIIEADAHGSRKYS